MKNPFDAHQCDNDQKWRLVQQTRKAFKDIHALLMDSPSTSREHALAVTKLEEACMWAIKGICMYEEPEEEQP